MDVSDGELLYSVVVVVEDDWTDILQSDGPAPPKLRNKLARKGNLMAKSHQLNRLLPSVQELEVSNFESVEYLREEGTCEWTKSSLHSIHPPYSTIGYCRDLQIQKGFDHSNRVGTLKLALGGGSFGNFVGMGFNKWRMTNLTRNLPNP